jgi:uncharacterized protein YxeA
MSQLKGRWKKTFSIILALVVTMIAFFVLPHVSFASSISPNVHYDQLGKKQELTKDYKGIAPNVHYDQIGYNGNHTIYMTTGVGQTGSTASYFP